MTPATWYKHNTSLPYGTERLHVQRPMPYAHLQVTEVRRGAQVRRQVRNARLVTQVSGWAGYTIRHTGRARNGVPRRGGTGVLDGAAWAVVAGQTRVGVRHTIHSSGAWWCGPTCGRRRRVCHRRERAVLTRDGDGRASRAVVALRTRLCQAHWEFPGSLKSHIHTRDEATQVSRVAVPRKA